jgi:hypothetical protein
VRILLSMRLSNGGVGTAANGSVVVVRDVLCTVLIDWVSGVLERSMLSRLLPMLVKLSSSLESDCRSELMEVALEPERGRPTELAKRPLRAETALAGDPGVFGGGLCERADWEEIEEA